jgi:hypothetical protein
MYIESFNTTLHIHILLFYVLRKAVLAQSVERKTFNLVVVGSNPPNGKSRLAQLAEHLSYEQKATGSRPVPRIRSVSVARLARGSLKPESPVRIRHGANTPSCPSGLRGGT